MITRDKLEENRFYYVRIKGKTRLRRLGIRWIKRDVVALTEAWNYSSDVYSFDDVEFIEEAD